MIHVVIHFLNYYCSNDLSFFEIKFNLIYLYMDIKCLFDIIKDQNLTINHRL